MLIRKDWEMGVEQDEDLTVGDESIILKRNRHIRRDGVTAVCISEGEGLANR